METRKLILTLLTAVIITSGCAGDILPGENGETQESQPEQIPGLGLEVNSFSISDERLSPGQTAQVTLELQNYHREGVDLEEINLYNTGLLQAEKIGCNPEEEDLGPATDNINPVMECTWNVEAPSEEDMGGFSQRSASFSADITYDTAIENYQALEVEFSPLDDIESTNERSISFSNGEVNVDVVTESPVALGEEQNIDYRITRTGDGIMAEDIEFEYEPVEVFDLNGDSEVTGEDGECPLSDNIVLGSGLDFQCGISLDGSTSETRSLYFTAYYKYIKSPTLSITIVNN